LIDVGMVENTIGGQVLLASPVMRCAGPGQRWRRARRSVKPGTQSGVDALLDAAGTSEKSNKFNALRFQIKKLACVD
jgi:hypothetical protein